ncbi:MAG: acyl-CoA thioesterase [Candidatus Thioglobus autotrophicus]|jgi:acyl-CoA thioester hydrolase|nr:acyl-CoA thioesterase [Candidatus Thioglobus autotrophicus]
MNELLKDFTFVVDLNIEWGDMDALQHVNNIEYFKYFQVARIAYFEKINSDSVFGETRISLILASTQCKFIYPLAYPDSISVGVRVDTMADQYFTMKYAVVSHKHQRLSAIGDAKVVMFDYVNNKKASIPSETRKTIIDLEKAVDEIVDKD